MAAGLRATGQNRYYNVTLTGSAKPALDKRE